MEKIREALFEYQLAIVGLKSDFTYHDRLVCEAAVKELLNGYGGTPEGSGEVQQQAGASQEANGAE